MEIMKALAVAVLGACALAQAQNVQNIDVAKLMAQQIAPPSDSPDRVVAVVDGMKVTAGELFKYYSTLNSNLQYYLAQNRKELVERYVTARKVVQESLANKLDQKEPYKSKLIEARENILSEARLQDIAESGDISDQDQHKYYNEHLDFFLLGAARGILVMGTDEPAKKNAAGIVKQIRGGEPFEKIAKEKSADKNTGAQGGQLGMVAKSGPLPEPMRKTIFGLKPGEVSEPIEFNGSLWIFGLDKIQIKPFEEVKDEVVQRIKLDRVEAHLQAIRSGLNIKIQDEEYFKKPDIPETITLGAGASVSTPPKK
jgi:peptidyl-prolyl cis-trans isomerase C